MKKISGIAAALCILALTQPTLAQQPPVKIAGLVELSGTGTTSGHQFR